MTYPARTLTMLSARALTTLSSGVRVHARARFDGGIHGPVRPLIKSLLQRLQPNAMAFNSCGGTGFFPGGGNSSASCVTRNAIRDTGTEAGAVGNPNWSTQTFPDGEEMFVPSESDTTLQLADSWFYDGSDGIRSLAELQDVYHQTVGRSKPP